MPLSRATCAPRRLQRLVKAYSGASDTIPQNVVKDTCLLFHPGAIRYSRGIGIDIPQPLVPPN